MEMFIRQPPNDDISILKSNLYLIIVNTFIYSYTVHKISTFKLSNLIFADMFS